MSGINLKSKSFLDGLRLYEEGHKIDPEFVIEVLKEAVLKTYQKHIDAPDAKIRVDVANGREMHIFHILNVVPDDFDTYDETLDIFYSDAVQLNPDVKVGDEIEKEVDFSEIGRSSINVTKQMLKQKIKEYEKQRVFDEYKDKEFELVSGIIKTIDEKYVLVDLKTTIGILFRNEQLPGDVLKEGQSIRVVIKQVNKNSKGSQVILSRSNEMFVKRLFEKEVPEIQQGIVEIRAIAREAGERTKIAVYSKNDDVDPIGACIGPHGSRIQAVIVELKNEKIDVFEWNEDVGELIKNSLAPAEVQACFYSNEKIDPTLTPEEIEKHTKYNDRPICAVVEDDKLSLAIGKKGKNAKLAVKLTNRKIDIKTVSEIKELGIDLDAEVEAFKVDQERLIKEAEQKRFQAVQEEAIKKRQEFEQEIAKQDTPYSEDVFGDGEKENEEIFTRPQEEVKQEPVEAVKEEPANTSTETVKKEPKSDEVVVLEKKPLAPKTEYKSSFEDIASTKKSEAQPESKKHKKKTDKDRRLRADELEKKEYSEDVKPLYSEEELDEIAKQEQEQEDNSWINDDDIDFDEYDEYYDEEN